MNVPQAVGGSNSLDGMVAIDENDMWAVGSYSKDGKSLSLTQHWDGNAWNIIQSPNTDNTENRLQAVKAKGKNNVWAVGYHMSSTPQAFSSGFLTMHWDGTQWTIFPTPYDSRPYSIDLKDVYVVSDNEAWAVGTDGSGVMLHWDGTEWKDWNIDGLAKSQTDQSVFYSIEGTSATDIWAFGSLNGNMLAIHWNGQTWTIVPMPSGPYSNRISGIKAFAADKYVTYGSYASSDYTQDAFFNWDGSSWQESPVHLANRRYLITYRLAGADPNNLWISKDSGDTYNDMRAVVEHFNGQYWQSTPLPQIGTGYTTIRDIATPTKNITYAAGWYVDGLVVKSMILKYELPQPTPSPTVTQLQHRLLLPLLPQLQ
jgi:hypothetical protein